MGNDSTIFNCTLTTSNTLEKLYSPFKALIAIYINQVSRGQSVLGN